jgi:hypothetical protein
MLSLTQKGAQYNRVTKKRVLQCELKHNKRNYSKQKKKTCSRHMGLNKCVKWFIFGKQVRAVVGDRTGGLKGAVSF